MKKFILSSAFIVAGCFLATAQNSAPAKPVAKPMEQAVATEEPAKAKPACDANSPKKACCSHDKKTSSAKSVKHKKHSKKMCKADCCVKKESN